MYPAILIIYTIIQILFILGIGLSVLYIFIFSFAGLFYRQKDYPEQPVLRRIAVLIPGYKEDAVIGEVAKDALLQDYPQEDYDVVVIADSFRQDTLTYLHALPVKIIEVKFAKSTKSLALNKAMELLPEIYDIAVILDADNLMGPGFLTKINAAFDLGSFAVQGHRKAKNTDTSLAVLDAISEEINNHIFRKGHRVMGLSSAIIGSGMAFQYSYFKSLMSSVTAIGGFDKDIELRMLKEGRKIIYLDDAEVLDEKVQKEEAFSNQRRRWLSAQLVYFRRDFFSSLKALITEGNIDYFDKAIQFIQLPRVLLLGSVFLSGTIFTICNHLFSVVPYYTWTWAGIALLCILAFLFSVPGYYYNTKTLKALLSLPKGMLLMLGSLLHTRGANKGFIHTQHSAKTPSKS
jgi:cellulose synthase/poly-beta-1,6-N-acetylglucosamine synthase-like glycosyltransferase